MRHVWYNQIRLFPLVLQKRRLSRVGGGGVMAFTVVSLQGHHLSLKTTYTTK